MAVERVSYGGWENCYRVSNGLVEAIATSDVGPRIIRFGFIGGENEFYEFPEQLGKTGGDEWRIYGGHRLWHAPEVKPRTYYPDNEPVEVKILNDFSIELIQPTEKWTGIQKRIVVNMHGSESQVTVTHILTNHNLWAIELAPWALSAMAKGGVAILPQPPFIPHEEKLLPARPLVQWHYTDMTDPRWIFGKRFIMLRQDPKITKPQKLGIANFEGWVAYSKGERLFLKRYKHIEGATYPDFGCSTEVFTNAEMLELETLGPLTILQPGESVEYVEKWFLFKGVILGETEEEIDEVLKPILEASGTCEGEKR
ncbi:MAG: hypothetical protein NZ805_04830 [Armatimonadetes bacterium]|nr:hypothetical protein [Armatimonadota bacterium]MDW8027815.1 hypothetical protein [Armatimonadota bacterium]